MIAGTAIGAGMIALPMTLAKLGLVATIALMAVTWLVVYYSALLGTELTSRIGINLSLNEISKYLGGRTAELIAIGCIMVLSYALLAAYLYGGSSISASLIDGLIHKAIPVGKILKIATLSLLVVLTLSIKWIDYINRAMFFSLIGLLLATILGLSTTVNMSTLPLETEMTRNLSTWTVAIPIIFTSFGFQMMIPAISSYLDREPKQIRNAFFWGSLIPVIIYVSWTIATLGTLSTQQPGLFQQIITGSIDVGQFVNMLSTTTTLNHLQILVWSVSIFAIITSAFGVALGLIDLWEKLLPVSIGGRLRKKFVALITVIPPFIIALLTPGAFIKALGFAGMILVVIAIILPTYLIYKSDALQGARSYKIIQSHFVRMCGLIFAIGLIVCELINMIS